MATRPYDPKKDHFGGERGAPVDPTRCLARVWSRWNASQCGKRPEPGSEWCAHHDPVAMATRRRERLDAATARMARARAERIKRAAAPYEECARIVAEWREGGDKYDPCAAILEAGRRAAAKAGGTL